MVLSKVKEWQYPVIAKSPNNSEDKRNLESKCYNQALLSAKNGFYPVGLNKLVHMGIHIDKDALNKLGVGEPIKTQVNCIADGEVIAYRINGHYPKVDYGDKVAFFSTGFVLVRHLLEMERVPEKKTETTESNSPAAENSTLSQAANADTNSAPTTSDTTKKEEKQSGHQLYFYSLYMHLADSAYYDKYSDEPAPAFWDQDTYRVIKHEQLNYIEGLNIRKNPNGLKKDEILAVLQEGTKVNLNLAIHDEKKQWYAVSSLAEGYSSIPVLTPQKYQYGETTVDILGWIYTGREVAGAEFTILGSEEDKKLVAKNAANEMKSNQNQFKGLRVWNDYANNNDKKLYSMLPVGTQIKISGTKKPNNYVELIEVVRDGKPTNPLPTEKKKVWYDCLENITRGEKYDEVVVLDKPFPIKAGELVGHIGNYQNYEDAIDKEKDKEGKHQDIESLPSDTLQKSYFKPLLHVECFTCEDLTHYITQTQTEAGKLVDVNKPFLALSKGAKLLEQPNIGDTTVGKPYKDTKIKIVSNNVNINWIQLEVKSSETETRTLWIENTEEVAKTAKPNGEITLNENTIAWSQHPLQVSKLSKSSQIVDMPVLLYLNDEKLTSRDKRANDEQGNLWWKVEALDEKNLPIVGWVSNKGEEVKKVSAWDWFDFTQVTESASSVEFYKNVALSEKRNKDNPSLDKYQPTLKSTLSVLDRQYPTETKKYVNLKGESFKGIIEKPILSESIGRLLVNYESEWHSEIDAEGKMPKWEALNSMMTDDAENVLGYLKDGDQAKLDTYLSNKGLTQNSEEALMLKNQREKVCKMPTDYYEDKESLLTPDELALYHFMKHLEKQVAIWQQEKEKIKQCLWWDDVVKGLANQKQPTSEVNAGNENGDDTNTQTAQIDASSPATLNQDGKAWFIHPISIINYFSANNVLYSKGDKDEVIREINIRLAGFGGNVPTDKFTDKTEKMIKQFQRDYMKVKETGVVDTDVIVAIDKFQKEYPIGTYLQQAKCKCSEFHLAKGDKPCGGFGRGGFAAQKQDKGILELYRKYEYPGIHRTLFWVLRAWQFYLKHFDKQNIEIDSVSSGYRCWSDNNYHNHRKSTNHMGKALDIKMIQKNSKIEVPVLCDNARDVMIKYCDAHYRWSTSNVISLEPGNRVRKPSDKAVAPTWVHFDVRSFELGYLEDKYFAKSVEQVDGLSMQKFISAASGRACYLCNLQILSDDKGKE